MLSHHRQATVAVFLAILPLGCRDSGVSSGTDSTAPLATVIKIHPGPKVQEETQTALIKAKPGDTIEFGEGVFEFTMGLSLAVENVTLRGQGMDKTTLSFKKQNAGSEGLLVTRGKFVIEDLSIDDTKGDAIKVNDADTVTFRRMRTQWTGGEKETNGAYGIYPVQCKNVLIEECVAIGAADAGIYVGQCNKAIVRKCRTERNVAGIEIENCTDADVYENYTTNNAGGLLVFDLPDLPVKNGKRIRVFQNQVVANNHENFAPKGNMVAEVSPGTGLMIMASSEVEVFQNTIRDNDTWSLSILSFLITGRPLEDKAYDPIPKSIYVHDNTFQGGGTNPRGDIGQTLAMLWGKPLPEIMYDGIRKSEKNGDGKLGSDQGIYLKHNGPVKFANLHWDKLDWKKPKELLQNLERDAKPDPGELPPLPVVTLPGAS
jgi:parallel beta-helix repeat protein